MIRQQYYSLIKAGSEQSFFDALRDGQTDLKAAWHARGVSTLSVFVGDSVVCVYLEAEDGSRDWVWPDAFAAWLEAWPDQAGNRLAVPMIDIFHDGVPSDPVTWRGDRPVESRVGSFAKLKPEMAASYIFYHYQLQEEKPESFNKTYMIGAHGTLLFSYVEHPATVSESKLQGKLATNHTPDNWHEVMVPHFVLWPNVSEEEEIWRKMERVFGF